MKKIFLYGGGGHAKVIIDIIKSSYGMEALQGVFDDDPLKEGKEFYGSKILGRIDQFQGEIDHLLIAIGDNETRAKKARLLAESDKNFITVVHPSAIIAPSAKIGRGTVIMPGVIINADAKIGDHCIINTGAIIEHDCIVDDYTHIAPKCVLTGGVHIGCFTLLGANSVVVPYKNVGSNCLIGAGSVITKNISDFALVRGNPARVIKILKAKSI